MLQKIHTCLFGILAVLSLMLCVGNFLPQPTSETQPGMSQIVCDVSSVATTARLIDLAPPVTFLLSVQSQEPARAGATLANIFVPNQNPNDSQNPLYNWLITALSGTQNSPQMPARNCGK